LVRHYHNKNIGDFEIHFWCKKRSNPEFVLFEDDKNFPAFINDIKKANTGIFNDRI
jgi:hypothetical protein